MSRWRWFRSGWDTAISLPPRIFIRIWTTLPRFLQQKQCWTGLEWVQIRKMTLKKVWFLSKTGRFLSCYEIVKLKNSVFCIKKRYKLLKKHVVPLICGASEIWTLAALQTPYRISRLVRTWYFRVCCGRWRQFWKRRKSLCCNGFRTHRPVLTSSISEKTRVQIEMRNAPKRSIFLRAGKKIRKKKTLVWYGFADSHPD